MTKREYYRLRELAKQRCLPCVKRGDAFAKRFSVERSKRASRRPFTKSPLAWMDQQRKLARQQNQVEPILRIKKKYSWRLNRVLPAVPKHSWGTLGEITDNVQQRVIYQGMILKNPGLGIRTEIERRKAQLVNAKIRKVGRSAILRQKARILNALEVLPVEQVPGGGRIPRSLIEVPTFEDAPMDKKIRHMNPTRGRDANGFLVSTLI